MPLNSFEDVQKMLDAFVASKPGTVNMSASPHATFWKDLDYVKFTTGDVPGVVGPGRPGKTLPILKKGDSKNSNIILALQGAAGTIFDPSHDGGDATGIGPMPPFFGGPSMSAADIADLASWIDRGCPEFAAAPTPVVPAAPTHKN
jgi:hypothetical protein